MRRLPCLILLTLAFQGALADHHGERDLRRPVGALGIEPNRLLPEMPASVSNERAASLVKERYAAARILGVLPPGENGPQAYRVRILLPDGVVKSVFVDGQSGEVFE